MTQGPAPVKATVLKPADLIGESMAGIAQRTARSIMTMLGTVVGTAAFVGILGLTTTAGAQIGSQFNALTATQVTVADAAPDSLASNNMPFPPDADQRVKAIDGVIQAGLTWPVPLSSPTVRSSYGLLGTPDAGKGIAIVAADPEALQAMHPSLSSGRTYDQFAERTAAKVALVGRPAARRLGIEDLTHEHFVFIDDTAYAVMGIADDFDRNVDALDAVIIPSSTALKRYGAPKRQTAQMLVQTRLGAAEVVADQVALALRPDAPQLFRAIAPADPTTLRRGVSSDFNSLYLVLAAVSLLVGAIGIANTTLIGVLERTNEIGLRRALGARRRHIAIQFLCESTALGALGGLTGAALGTGLVLAVTVARHWTSVLEPAAVLAAPLIGTVVGLAAGLYPALRAARIQPIDALRR
jgi:putative ABC transport system permease protein